MKSLLKHSIHAALFSCTIAGLPQTASADKPEPGFARLLVQPRIGTSPSQFQQLIRNHHGEIERTLKGIDIAVTKVPEPALEKVKTALEHNPHIQFVEADRPLALSETLANDTYFDQAWHLATINAPLAWDSSFGDSITVAVLDTGINASHVDLTGKTLSGWNIAGNNGDYSDINGHGTEVAGVIGAISNNNIGVTSVAWNAMILPVRVSNSTDGVAYTSDIANALVWAADHGADVANISYDVTSSTTIENAAKYMNDRGGVVVVAAGNSGSDMGYQDNPYVISVSATDASDTRTSWSSYGNYVDVAAPGLGIYSTTRDGGYGKVSGTSFSSPLTAGVIALMKAANPGLTPSQLEQALENSAVDLGEPGFDTLYGHGRVDAAEAVAATLNSPTPDTTAPTVALTSPASGSTVSDQVSVDINAADDTAVDRVELSVNGTRIGTDSAPPYAFSWDTTSTANGNTVLTARAFDTSGNAATDEIAVTVSNQTSAADTMPPTIDILSPGDGATVSGTVSIDVDAHDDKALSSVTVSLDGNILCVSTTAPFSCNWNTRKSTQGLHTLSATAVDTSANQARAAIEVSVSSSKGGGSKTTGNGKGNGKLK